MSGKKFTLIELLVTTAQENCIYEIASLERFSSLSRDFFIVFSESQRFFFIFLNSQGFMGLESVHKPFLSVLACFSA